MTKIVSKECLNPGGHDFVSIERTIGSTVESWIECYYCHMNKSEIELNERDCFEHYFMCVRCGKHFESLNPPKS